MINARIDDVENKIMFKDLLKNNRCVAIVEGFYEWDSNNNPFCI